ncbi:hypothetical protein [Guptibacillus hwajinpoensis]|uniref:Uncharacterized protein n=1 Tax=Guptibacillus hwajinpoensis TaxID=208199 RepID=A0A0J6FYI1_9BACL|nr:hypothetical protein [Alkalihalobacillus macyae]KMM39427.1 hypothetical protein AB986_09595 [Alkalihalobacillus macyae]
MECNVHLLKMLIRDIVAKLPEKEKALYHFIDELELRLIESAATPDQYLHLLKKYSPYHEAANHFGISPYKARTMMHRIEWKVAAKLEEKLQCMKWLEQPSNSKRVKKGYLTF